MAVMLMPCQAFGADPVSAELAMARYKALTTVVQKRCVRSSSQPDQIIVCANNISELQRVPLYADDTKDRRRKGEARPDRGPPCPPRGCPGNEKLLDGIALVLAAIRD